LFYVSFVAYFGGCPAQTLAKYKLCIANEHKTEDVQAQGPSNMNLSLFGSFFDVYRAS